MRRTDVHNKLNGEPEWDQRYEIIELIRSVHGQAQYNGQIVQSEDNLEEERAVDIIIIIYMHQSQQHSR